MKLAIIGGRDFNNYNLLKDTVNNLDFIPSMIVSGGARGADSLGKKYAKEMDIKTCIFLADWDDIYAENCKIAYGKYGGKPYNVLAGFNRNKLIIEKADVVLAFWDGKSAGTKHSICLAIKTKKKVTIIKYRQYNEQSLLKLRKL